MKKIFISLVVPLFFVMIIWLVNFQFTYGDLSLLTSTHLDLKSMFKRFSLNSDLSTNFAYTFRSMIESFKTLQKSSIVSKLVTNLDTTGWAIALNGFEALTSPFLAIAYPITFLGYSFVLILQFLGITTVVATALFDFIFNPVFIVRGTHVISPITIPDLPPVITPPNISPI